MSESILVEEAGGALRLTIDRQPRLNTIVLARRKALPARLPAADAAAAGLITGCVPALAREKDGQIELLTSADFLEGMTAMLTRRAPNSTGAVHPVAEPA
ncbi:hypothetical protein ACFYO7_23475 [Nocardia salmonicida]|uniref:hypothetical protein n=1 Tax=Nocardia salmonicida TaxID=53431 RepID=UPI00368B686A